MRAQPIHRLHIGATISHDALNRAVTQIAQSTHRTDRGWALLADQIDTTVAPTTRTIVLARAGHQETLVFWTWGSWASADDPQGLWERIQ